MWTRMIALMALLPSGGGLRDEDWARRHRLLTTILAATIVVLTALGVLADGLAGTWLLTVFLILPCVLAASRLPGRRLPSMFVALGFVVACGGFVAIAHGLTEAHFTFFIVIAALALYRDWTPFGMFLVATTLHHGVFGVLYSSRTYDHDAAFAHPWTWALLHGVAVLLAAGFQVIAWRLTESEEARAQQNLDESQAQLSIAFDQTPVPMAMIAPDGRLLRTNEAYRNWLDLPAELPAGFRVDDLPLARAEQDGPGVFEQILNSDEPVALTREYRRLDTGKHIWVDVHATGLRDQEGRLRLIFVHCVDVTANRRHQEELHRQVRQDSLTGLLSRSAFEQDLSALLAAGPDPVSVIYLDVDRFKSINDGAGHTAGDDVLRALSARLAATVPAGALVARLGGDEFVVALRGGTGTALITGHALLDACEEPLLVDGGHLQISISVGVASTSGGDAESVVLAADTAMYQAKRAGGNRVAEFNDQMRVAVRDRIAAEARLRRALAGDKETALPVWFQPIVGASGELVGAETLVRMRTPEGTILGPGLFVPAAEETGLIVPLGEHVLNLAVRQLLEWGDQLGYVSVNVSPRQLAEPDFVPDVAALLARHPGLDPSRLILEITETALLGSSLDVQQRLEMLKAIGVRIALDDFGTGYSSLTWLQSIPADIVKLDRSFVAGLSADPRKSSIIEAVLWLARSLNMAVVAEGVEDEADWAALRALGCPSAQGYYFSRPLPPAEFERTVLQRSRMATTP